MTLFFTEHHLVFVEIYDKNQIMDALSTQKKLTRRTEVPRVSLDFLEN